MDLTSSKLKPFTIRFETPNFRRSWISSRFMKNDRDRNDLGRSYERFSPRGRNFFMNQFENPQQCNS